MEKALMGWQDATMNEWYMNDTQVGTWQSARNLSYAKVSLRRPGVRLGFVLTLDAGSGLVTYGMSLALLAVQLLTATGRIRRPARHKRHDPTLHGRRLLPPARSQITNRRRRSRLPHTRHPRLCRSTHLQRRSHRLGR